MKYIFAGANRVASVSSPVSLRGGTAGADEAISYFHSDHLGSSNVITDSKGQQVGFTEFTPYGSTYKQTGTYNPKHKFTGKELDSSTGLYFYGARYYDPQLGRFITADPTIQSPYDPQDLNRYAYCRNNPINLVDPSGLGFKSWFKKIFSQFGSLLGSGGLNWAGFFPLSFPLLLAGSIYTSNWQPMAAAAATAAASAAGAALASAFVAPAMASFFSGGGVHALTGIQGGIITGVEFGITGFAGGFAGTLAGGGSLNDALSSGGIGFGIGFITGGIVGYSYTQGWQSVMHGYDAQELNIKIGLKEAVSLRKAGNLQAAYDKEMGLVKQYGGRKAVMLKGEMTTAQYGKFVKNSPALREIDDLKIFGRAPITTSGIAEYRDGIPNFVRGTFTEMVNVVEVTGGQLTVTYTDMPDYYIKLWPSLSTKSTLGSYSSKTSIFRAEVN